MDRREGFPEAEEASRRSALGEARNLPGSWYVDERAYEADVAGILRPSWQYAGASAELAETGSCILTDVAGLDVVVVRAEDGGLRAFRNVCRHRGGPLVRGACRLDGFQCAYHGWRYALDGRLLGTPQFKPGPGFRREDHGLFPIAVGTWQDMVFVHCGDGPEPLEDWFDPVATDLAPVRLAGKRLVARDEYRVESDWKAYVDNFLEAYHLPNVHPAYLRTLDYRGYSYALREHHSLQRARLSDDAGYYAVLEEPGAKVDWASYVWVWPNLMFNVLPGRVQVNHVRPDGPGRCIVRFDYYYSDGVSEALLAEDRRVSDRIQAEDADICSRVQRNLASGGYVAGPLVPGQESAVHHFQDLVRDSYRRWIGIRPASVARVAGGEG